MQQVAKDHAVDVRKKHYIKKLVYSERKVKVTYFRHCYRPVERREFCDKEEF